MDDLMQFLRARYDEEAASARAAMDVVGPVPGAERWRSSKGLSDEGGTYWCITTTAPNDTVPTVELVGSGMSGGGVHDEAVAQHVTRHDPEHVLRDIESKRQIVSWVEQSRAFFRQTNGTLMPAAYRVLGPLAAVYANHPDYRQEWRP